MRTGIRILAPLMALAAVPACTTIYDLQSQTVGTAVLSFADGTPAGTAQLLAKGDQLSLAISVTAVAPGPHGFHLHSVGSCVTPDFKSAGGHLNPFTKSHGSLSANGAHLGDLPNLQVGASQTASTEVDLAGNAANLLDKILDADGTAVVIHAGADDYRTDPSGNAGGRIACGVLSRAS
ncbi:superoxide dismutase family protein [Qipengyuania marisflavi]|uniref:Superoxide dismutase family protein n=2 Tax=Qipengyuania marisflavi TaxID=2486356 RepID=A0A5S3P683_9SPHN|nr:superoxide dismutase family protein [Qipengyuania marisflavi]